MKIKQEFILRDIAGDYVLIPVANIDDSFHGIISLNETGAFIWKQLEQGKTEEQIVQALLEEYTVSQEQAAKNVSGFLKHFRDLDILE